MLHAFNHKGVRRIFARETAEHTYEKTEDAITSMVFSPLAFMSADDLLTCMNAFLGNSPLAKSAGRWLKSHHFQLWPSGMIASSWTGDAMTRCEPDLLLSLQFEDGPSLTIIGELKCDWRMHQDDLARELEREREAVRRSVGGDLVQFVLTKHGQCGQLGSVPVHTWLEVAHRLSSLARTGSGPPARWATEVRTFLAKLDVHSFGGFPREQAPEAWLAEAAFWKVHSDSTLAVLARSSALPRWLSRHAFWRAE